MTEIFHLHTLVERSLAVSFHDNFFYLSVAISQPQPQFKCITKNKSILPEKLQFYHLYSLRLYFPINSQLFIFPVESQCGTVRSFVYMLGYTTIHATRTTAA